MCADTTSRPNPAITIRRGLPGGGDFLRAMLYEAAFWRSSERRPPLEDGLEHPELAKILHAWGERPGDTNVTAISLGGERLGAAWYRSWRDDNHSYGFVDDKTPEIGIGVLAGARRRGIGRALLEGLVAEARDSGVQALSLSVERDNGAKALYTALGFRAVATVGNSVTMVLDLGKDT